MAKWLRTRRAELHLSQEQVVAALAAVGPPLSRGHYANLERGQTELRDEYVAALDHVLQGGGELIALADRKWDRAMAFARNSEWAQIGRKLELSLLGDLSPSPEFDASHAQEWLESHPRDEAIVIEGASQVQEVVTALLSIAANDKFPSLKPPIEFSGTFAGFRSSGRAGLPLPVRHALRTALERGWKCRHHIPLPQEHRADASLVFVASPLFACQNFEARIVDPEKASTVENLLIIPGLASVQFYATSSPAHLDVAVIHQKDETSRVLAERIRQLTLASTPFVDRFERPARATEEQETDEIEFRRLLADVAQIEGPCRLFLGWFSTATIPKEDYARSVDERARRTTDTHPGVWKEMVTLQLQRAALLQQHLRGKISYRTIIRRDLLQKFASDEKDNSWRYTSPDEKMGRLNHILALMKEFPSFEVAIAPDRLAGRLTSNNWEVREDASRGVVLVQTNYTSLTSDGDKRETRPVDLKIEAMGAVRAFMALHQELWNDCLNDQNAVKKELRKARAKLGA